MKGLISKLSLGALVLSLSAQNALAQVFPVDAGTTTTITSVKRSEERRVGKECRL